MKRPESVAGRPCAFSCIARLPLRNSALRSLFEAYQRIAFRAALLVCTLLPSVSLSAAPTILSISVHGNQRTRDETILRELLFKVGDSLDSTLVAESERNLRSLLFLGRPRIVTEAIAEGVAVAVHVQDRYARGFSPRLSGQTDELSYGIVAVDYNAFGRGQTARVSLDHDPVTGNWATGSYLIPRLAGSRARLYAFAGGGSEGHDLRSSLSRPFHSLAARGSWGVSVSSRQFVQRLYSSETLVDKYQDRLDNGALWLARSYGDRLKLRPEVRLSVSDRQFSPEPGFIYAPTNRRRILPSVGVTVWRPRYEIRSFVRDLGRTEDLQTGSLAVIRAGFSSDALGSDRSFSFYSLQLSPRARPHPDLYLFGLSYLNARYETGRLTNITAGAQLSAYRQISGLHTLAVRIRWDALSRSEDNSQFLLGVDRGLRGYSPRRFDGSRRLILNAEARPTHYRHRKFIVGSALFADAGTAWTPGKTSADLNASAGLGLRVSFPQIYDHMLVRSDLAYGFQNRLLQLSFGIGHYF
jgi:hypothetical protein